jgi:hypothetical protein
MLLIVLFGFFTSKARLSMLYSACDFRKHVLRIIIVITKEILGGILMTDQYTQDFRHFDNLIWQLPGWSTAIFVLSITGLSQIADGKLDCLNLGFSTEVLAAAFLIVCWFFQTALFNALVRFRAHQIELKITASAFAKWWYSGQFWLQNAVILQSGGLAFLAVRIMKADIAIATASILMVVMFLYSLLSIHFKETK